MGIESANYSRGLRAIVRFRAIRVAAVLAAAAVPFAASAQGIRGGDLPGRERERFVTPPPPLSEPRGPVIVLPSTAPPSGAERIMLTVRDICIKGATVYSTAGVAPLYRDRTG